MELPGSEALGFVADTFVGVRKVLCASSFIWGFNYVCNYGSRIFLEKGGLMTIEASLNYSEVLTATGEGKPQETVLVGERNSKVLLDVDQALSQGYRKIGVLYGGLHIQVTSKWALPFISVLYVIPNTSYTEVFLSKGWGLCL